MNDGLINSPYIAMKVLCLAVFLIVVYLYRYCMDFTRLTHQRGVYFSLNFCLNKGVISRCRWQRHTQ